jgi:aryl-alcohol dehydrogenase-like predicted oxidoreductase
MEYRPLGRTGLKVSEICFGAMTLGDGFNGIGEVKDQGAADALVHRALDAGVTFFDTADVYSRGQSETILGQSLQNSSTAREAVVLATKVRGAMSDAAAAGTADVNNVGLSRSHILDSCDASLRRLGTDHIDLYQVHGWDPVAPVEETMRALADLVTAGKVRYLGVSNWAVRQIAKANAVADAHGWPRFVSLQAYYSLVGRDLEHELIDLCVEDGLGVMAWSPLAGGFLSGKFRRGQDQPEGSRRTTFDFPPVDKEKAYDVVDALDEMAQAKGVTIPQLGLAWLLQRRGVTSIIVGAKRPEQLDDNLGAVGVTFTADELERLDGLTKPDALYPQWMIAFQGRGREAVTRSEAPG